MKFHLKKRLVYVTISIYTTLMCGRCVMDIERRTLDKNAYSSAGLAVQKLKDQFKLIDTQGRQVFSEDMSERQIRDIFKFLEMGCFEGMFRTNSLDHYQTVLDIHFDEVEKVLPTEDKSKIAEAKIARGVALSKYYSDLLLKNTTKETEPLD